MTSSEGLLKVILRFSSELDVPLSQIEQAHIERRFRRHEDEGHAGDVSWEWANKPYRNRKRRLPEPA